MAVRKEIEKEHAKLLFINYGLNQKNIADKVKVTEKTIGKWIAEGKWQEQKNSLINTRTSIIRELENQMKLWQDFISSRENKLADKGEVNVLIQLAAGIKKFESEASVGEIITVLMELVSFIQPIDFEFSKKLSTYADAFVKSKIK
ncbi:MAG: hypothetical protein RLZZ292_1044 [Bacteroidota bacterium]|jgi:DNA-binding XRE family transcriptional regulator